MNSVKVLDYTRDYMRDLVPFVQFKRFMQFKCKTPMEEFYF